MKIFLQQVASGCYLQSGGEWTRNIENALPFPNSLSALAYANQHELPAAQVVFRFGGTVEDIVVRIHDNVSFGAPEPGLRAQ